MQAQYAPFPQVRQVIAVNPDFFARKNVSGTPAYMWQ